MTEEKTPLGSIEYLSDSEIDSLTEKGIDSIEDLLAKAKSYGNSSHEISRLLGIQEGRITTLIEEARNKVSKQFLEMLDTDFDPEQFYFGALPPEEEDNN